MDNSTTLLRVTNTPWGPFVPEVRRKWNELEMPVHSAIEAPIASRLLRRKVDCIVILVDRVLAVATLRRVFPDAALLYDGERRRFGSHLLFKESDIRLVGRSTATIVSPPTELLVPLFRLHLDKVYFAET